MSGSKFQKYCHITLIVGQIVFCKYATSETRPWILSLHFTILPENVGVGTLASLLLERSSSTKFVKPEQIKHFIISNIKLILNSNRPLKAVGSICPILQLDNFNFCRLRSPCRLNTSRGRIWRLLPPKSKTWRNVKLSEIIDKKLRR